MRINGIIPTNTNRSGFERKSFDLFKLMEWNVWVVTLADLSSLIGWLTSLICLPGLVHTPPPTNPQIAIDLTPCRYAGRVCTHLCADLIDPSAPI